VWTPRAGRVTLVIDAKGVNNNTDKWNGPPEGATNGHKIPEAVTRYSMSRHSCDFNDVKAKTAEFIRQVNDKLEEDDLDEVEEDFKDTRC